MIVANLSPSARQAAICSMASEELDVLVIGGGVVGAGVALDAASRGLRTGIVECRDWGSGTSSRSSKLIHGGLRYLEMLDFRLVFEALRERGLLLHTIAPHLVRPVQFLYPLRHRGWERAYVGTGVLLYDLMSRVGGYGRGLPWHRHLDRDAARREFPGLAEHAAIGAITYSDAQVDDARHTVTLVRTAVTMGALAANRVKAVALVRSGEAVNGAVLIDQETGERYVVRAKRVVSAAGVWSDEIRRLAAANGEFTIRASKGVHLVVERGAIRGESGLIVRTDKSVLFVIPWGEHWIVGTTDTDWRLDLTHPAASARDVNYLLEQVNRVLERPLTLDDVKGVYAGLRPLLAGPAGQTTKLSREHVVSEPAPHLVIVAGGKYTTYRVMARDAVDVAARGLTTARSITAKLPLVGADGFSAQWRDRASLAREFGLPVPTVERLLTRYGSLAIELLDSLAADPSLAEQLASGSGYLRAEARYAVTHEGARHLDDVLARRTRLSIESWDRGCASAREVAALMAPVLGWGPATIEREVARYIERVDAERAAQREADDVSSSLARLTAPEIVPAR